RHARTPASAPDGRGHGRRARRPASCRCRRGGRGPRRSARLPCTALSSRLRRCRTAQGHRALGEAMSAAAVRTTGRIAAVAALFAFVVTVFGAFVRLSNAGLSCPDWPTCYGKATWPGHEHEIALANEAFPERPFEDHKAWREQIHRMLAGTLGLLVFSLA